MNDPDSTSTLVQAWQLGFEAARQVCMDIYIVMHRRGVLVRGKEGREAMVRAEGMLES